QCQLPAEVRERWVMESTDGPIEHLDIICVLGHGFRAAVDILERPVTVMRAWCWVCHLEITPHMESVLSVQWGGFGCGERRAHLGCVGLPGSVRDAAA
ncbi:MAG: hypothetical protein ACRDJF_11685, partial [Actinomycetota bacterium]